MCQSIRMQPCLWETLVLPGGYRALSSSCLEKKKHLEEKQVPPHSHWVFSASGCTAGQGQQRRLWAGLLQAAGSRPSQRESTLKPKRVCLLRRPRARELTGCRHSWPAPTGQGQTQDAPCKGFPSSEQTQQVNCGTWIGRCRVHAVSLLQQRKADSSAGE